MSDLQRESNSAFADPVDSSIQDELTAESAARTSDTTIQYADEPGADDYPAPPPIAGDGQGARRSLDDVAFADAGNEPELLDREQFRQAPQRQSRSLDDIHARPEGRQHAGREEWDPRVLARARRYGLTEAQVKATYQSPEQLEGALLSFDQQGLNQFRFWRQQQQFQQQQMQQQQQPLQPPAPPPVQPQSPAQPQLTDEELAELEYKLQNPDLYDDTLVEEMKGMSKHVADRFRKQHEHLKSLEQLVVAQQQRLSQWEQAQQADLQRREVEDFDEAIRSLGGDFEALFGSEKFEDLPPGDDRLKYRAQVWQLAKELQLFHATSQGRYVSPADVLPSSLNMTFPPDRQAATGRQRPLPPRDSQTGRFLAVPTGRQRRQPGVNRREETMRRWDRFFASRGFSGDSGSEGDGGF